MRPLSDDEAEIVFRKLAHYIGDHTRSLVERGDAAYCFRLHKDRVYYCTEKLMRKAACVSREPLLSFGTCLGKFTKTKKFRMHITALDYIAPYAKCKIWVKPSAEQQFLYGNNVLKSGMNRMTESAGSHQGVVVYNMNDLPLGFGVTAKSTAECRRAGLTSVVVLHQADLGEYVRNEAILT
ncbi:60S ribosome subunit biogenesis protein NIP7 [Loa loa]|uniref:60S ribosome subunit biogenesis protein NIP7 homolog n=1 Tax=Loa loa TaxID=7209 RepID=A0A1I7VME2_LOALO|nr:60S ribosome subunit biogenesis protein NIP7 [Loa loa]EFO24834.1 60S ribosome subunit biogenesis protein NIP7 [Loa loa]